MGKSFFFFDGQGGAHARPACIKKKWLFSFVVKFFYGREAKSSGFLFLWETQKVACINRREKRMRTYRQEQREKCPLFLGTTIEQKSKKKNFLGACGFFIRIVMLFFHFFCRTHLHMFFFVVVCVFSGQEQVKRFFCCVRLREIFFAGVYIYIYIFSPKNM